MAGDTVSILEGHTFVVSDRSGDVDASPTEPHGLFHQDTRFLSRWRLTVDGEPIGALSTDDVNYFSAQFFLVPAAATVYTDSPFSIIRARSVGDGFHEDLTVLNHTSELLELDLRVEAAADSKRPDGPSGEGVFTRPRAGCAKGRQHDAQDGSRVLHADA